MDNQIKGWMQKALAGTFIGGLKPEISYVIQLFKPQPLKEAIRLARMRDDQLTKQQQFT